MAISKLERLEGKTLIKHQAPKRYVYSNRKVSTSLNLKGSTPFVSALKRIDKMLENLIPGTNRKGHEMSRPKNDVEYVSVQGMGKCIPKLMDICSQFKGKGHRVEMFTRTVQVLDEFRDIKDEDEEDILRKRQVGCLEVHIYPN